MNLGNKLILLLLLPLVALFSLAYYLLDEIDLSQIGLNSQIVNSIVSKIDFNPFNDSMISVSSYDKIAQYSCKPGEIYNMFIKTPIEISWIGKTRSIMQSGEYYAFEKIPEDAKYPLFGGTFRNGATTNLDGTYEVKGNLVAIECGDYVSIFGSNSHPQIDIVSIKKIQ